MTRHLVEVQHAELRVDGRSETTFRNLQPPAQGRQSGVTGRETAPSAANQLP